MSGRRRACDLLRRLSLRHVVAERTPAPAGEDFVPTRVLVVDLEQPMPALTPASTPHGALYGAAEVLVRRDGRPLGLLEVPLPGGALSADALEERVLARFGSAVPGQDDRPAAALRAVPAPAASPSTPAVSVVVPTCRRPDDLERCVDSVLATGWHALEVLVVDNAPQDPRTAERVAARWGADPRVRYLQEWTPGASRARNLGVREASGSFVAFVDDDVLVDRGWVAALVAGFVAHPEVACVTGLVLSAAYDVPVQLWFERHGSFNRGYEPRLFDLGEHRAPAVLYPYTGGAFGGLGNAAFRVAALRTPDALDVTLGPGTPAFGAEDQELFLDLLRSGGSLLYEPAAVVLHRHRDTYAELRWQVFSYGAGYVAGLIASAVKDPRVLLDMLSKLPAVLMVLAGVRPRAALPPVPDYPCREELGRLERLGMLYGPVAYLRAVVQRRRRDALPAPAAGTRLAA